MCSASVFDCGCSPSHVVLCACAGMCDRLLVGSVPITGDTMVTALPTGPLTSSPLGASVFSYSFVFTPTHGKTYYGTLQLLNANGLMSMGTYTTRGIAFYKNAVSDSVPACLPWCNDGYLGSLTSTSCFLYCCRYCRCCCSAGYIPRSLPRRHDPWHLHTVPVVTTVGAVHPRPRLRGADDRSVVARRHAHAHARCSQRHLALSHRVRGV